MAGCPACGRPVAMAGTRCLYCGAELPEDLIPAAAAPEGARASDVRPPEEPSPPAARARVLLVIGLGGASPAALERALSLSSYEAALRARRGGLHLHGILEKDAATDELARLRGEGLAVETIPEAEVRTPPLRAIGGEHEGGRLWLRTEEDDVTMSGEELLIVVRGPIARQYQPSDRQRRLASPPPEEGYRVHFHRRFDPRPVEVDPGNFEFGFAVTGAARLEVESWLAAMGPDVPQDDGFRWLPPAFGFAEREPRTALSAVSRLTRAGWGGTAGPGQVTMLDNVAQFRFYSSWRAAIERRRARGDASV